MAFRCGIVGLPNVGKSTIFNALTSAKAEAANYPFCTIEPNVGMVPVPDDRLDKLAAIASSQKIIPTTVEFVDIAGLVKGASQGEGLGNQFLAHIRGVDALVHVVRAFVDDNVTHVHGSVGPVRDIEVIDTELILSDMEMIERRLAKVSRTAKTGDKEAKVELDIMEKAMAHLAQGVPIRKVKDAGDDFSSLDLITSKPVLYVANVAEEDAAINIADTHSDTHSNTLSNTHPDTRCSASVSSNSGLLEELVAYARGEGCQVVILSGLVESEISQLAPDERKGFLQEIGLVYSGLERLAQTAYSLLNYVTFFTVGPKEAHAWTCTKGSNAVDAAGKIHSDFARGFIRAEVIGYDDFISCRGEQGAREKGLLRVEGKTYIVADGDIMHFRFNV